MLTLQDILEILPLVANTENNDDDKGTRAYHSTHPAWSSGSGPLSAVASVGWPSRVASCGGCVYGQAILAAERELRETSMGDNGLGIHTAQATFSKPGLTDRPFIFTVTPLATRHNLVTRLVTVRQPMSPAKSSRGRQRETTRFTQEQAAGPLGPVIFTCLVTFKAAGPSGLTHLQESFPSEYRAILAGRESNAWPVAPSVNVGFLAGRVPVAGYQKTLPGLETRKVDMRAFNSGKPVAARRELVLYRLAKSLPSDTPTSVFAAIHAHASDLDAPLMLADTAAATGLPGMAHTVGDTVGLAAALYVHCGADGLVMRGGEEWWILEVMFPRVEAGRGTVFSRVWNPAGRHVATACQDAAVDLPQRRRGRGKL